MSKFEFQTYMRQKYPKRVSSYFDESTYTQILTCYQNRFDALIQKISFKKRIFKSFNLYKRNTKSYKKDDLKSVTYKSESTPLSICLTYLSRYGNENIIDYIKSNYNKVDERKRKFYDNILRCVDKFGFDRLYELALRKRNRIISKYNKEIEFKSLSFSGRTTTVPYIIEYNKNRHSKIAAFISIYVPFRKRLDIPVKYSHLYHGSMTDYKKEKDKTQYLYTIQFDEYKKQICIILCKDGERYLPKNKENYIGIDVNVKHNLFSLSNDTVYDFDRQLVNEYITELNKVDKLKENKNYQIGKRRQIKLNVLQRKIKHSNQLLISNICKDLKSQGFDHIIMENLDNSFKRSYSKNEEYNEKYNRLTHILNIGSLKDEFKHIAVKYDIAVSFVHAEYTSQMCEHCGCIESENRQTQEEFICINCGHTMNADLHAAIII